jgi:copper chaperone
MTFQLTVPNLACSACSTTIANAIKTIAPNAQVEADPKTKLVSVETQASEAAVKSAIVTAGYTVA